MRRVIKITYRIRGEDLADKYVLLLSDRFPQKFNLIKRVYEELSVCLHAANASTEQFETSRKDIEQHSQQLELLPLKELDDSVPK